VLVAAAALLAAGVPAAARQSPPDKVEAAKVAKKVERAKDSAHNAEIERHALREFKQEVDEYEEFHTKQLEKLKRHLTGDAASAEAMQKALAAVIVAKRDDEKAGDFFEVELVPVFRRLIAEQLKGPDAGDARKAVLEGNPAEEDEGETFTFVPKVNTPYPDGAPRSTVPPSVLLVLPPLPECLQYRFVGRDLILVDSVAQIIVDFIPGAAPDLEAKQ
jgi:hypothetical protein